VTYPTGISLLLGEIMLQQAKLERHAQLSCRCVNAETDTVTKQYSQYSVRDVESRHGPQLLLLVHDTHVPNRLTTQYK
jgi:hypothetical protein